MYICDFERPHLGSKTPIGEGLPSADCPFHEAYMAVCIHGIYYLNLECTHQSPLR